MDLSTATPAEVDGVLFPLLEQIARVEQSIGQYRYLLGDVGRKPTGLSRRNVRDDGLEYHDPGVQARQFRDSLEAERVKLADLNDQAAPYEAEYEERPWTRYIVVPGGHLHKRNCHTLTPGRTMVGQVAEASGLDEADVVAKYDLVACTHCFPNAPVEPKKTPAEEGFCEQSGEYLTEAQYGHGRRYCRCPKCGEHVAVTKGGKFRKHKAAV